MARRYEESYSIHSTYVYIERRRVNASSMYSSRQLPEEGYGTSWNKCGMGNEGGTRKGGEKEREREEGRERKRKGLHESSPLSLELEQWKLVKFKRIFDRIADIRARKWEKNIRRILVDVRWYATMKDTLCNLHDAFLFPGRLPREYKREWSKRKKGTG